MVLDEYSGCVCIWQANVVSEQNNKPSSFNLQTKYMGCYETAEWGDWEFHSAEDVGWGASHGPVAKVADNSIPVSSLLQTFRVHDESFSG